MRRPAKAAAAPIQVLIVDDSPAVRFLLRYRLCSTGRFEVVGEAADGREGIEKASDQQPDIILVDREMPVMDGFEAIPHLVHSSPRSVIIMLSSAPNPRAASAVAAKAIALGADAYIEKWDPPNEVLRRIVEVWDSAAT